MIWEKNRSVTPSVKYIPKPPTDSTKVFWLVYLIVIFDIPIPNPINKSFLSAFNKWKLPFTPKSIDFTDSKETLSLSLITQLLKDNSDPTPIFSPTPYSNLIRITAEAAPSDSEELPQLH